MPATFQVFSLGNFASIDPTEGNAVAENAASLVGLTVGSASSPLVDNLQTFSATGSGFGGGNTTVYDQDNTASSDQFSIDGGPAQTFDGTSVYNATLTFTDGSTAVITAVVFQDTAGNTYLSPEFSANADQAALESGVLQSITLDSLVGDTYSGMTGSREAGDYMLCFTDGTMIRTPGGERTVQSLRPGDLVMTLDNGPQPVRWISGNTVEATGAAAPIRIRRGALGPRLPRRDLIVSRQHRLLVQSKLVQRMFGTDQALISAARLLALRGVSEVRGRSRVTYWHFLCDRHEVVFANGAPAETLFLGANAQAILGAEALREIRALCPGALLAARTSPAHDMPERKRQKRLVVRARQNKRHLLEDWAARTAQTRKTAQRP